MDQIWNSPESSSVNRLPMLNLEHPTYVSLDGYWNFQLLSSPDAPIGKNWGTIPVPGLWTMIDGEQPFGDKPIYTNTQMPWDHFAPEVPKENPTGIYERNFTISDNLRHKRIVLQIGATESVHILYINGEAVGAGKDSHLASEYDITKYVKAGTNAIRIKVIKWSDATYIEDQDQWWHGGISRSIKLYFTDKVFIERLYANPTLLTDNKTGNLHVRAHINSIENEPFVNYKLQVKIKAKKVVTAEAKVIQKRAPNWTEKSPEEHKAGQDFFLATYWDGAMPKAAREAWLSTEPIIPGPLELNLKLPVAPWSAETPNVYSVEYLLVDPSGKVVQTATQQVGFRRVETKNGEFLLNGQPIIFYGINRHDFNKRTGRVISKEDYRADLLALKKFNFNAVRTSHYPNDPVFMQLCDEIGFYVIDEADIESHAFQNQLCDDQKYLSQWLDRTARLVQRDIHHASAVMWSLGNESGAGLNHRAAAAYVRSFDPTRPLHYEGAIRGNWNANYDLSDVICPMYPSISAITSYAKSANNPKFPKRPLIMCEYSHAMGNSNGTLKEYWDAIHKYKGLQGGFIWEMWDHGLDQTLPDGTKRSAYGGNYGEIKHDGNFVCDGMFFPDRSPKPAMQEFKYLAAPVFITRKGAKYQIFNKNFFVDLSGYRLRYEITIDGDLESFGNIKLPAVKPRKSVFFAIPARQLQSREAGERFITFILENKGGHEVAWEQFALRSSARKKSTKAKSTKAAKLVSEGLIGFDLAKILDRDGNLQLPMQEVAPKLTLWRAPTDNDVIGAISYKWDQWGLKDLTLDASKATKQSKKAKVTRVWRTGAGISIKHIQDIQVFVGAIKITETITLPKQLDDVARVGINFELNGALSNYRYFGIGPHETVPDRAIGRVEKYLLKVEELLTDYIKPQENGGRVGIRWFELIQESGKGLRFELDKPRMVTTLPVRSTDLAEATHNVYLKRCGNTVVTIDAAHRGVGTASCGPDTLDKYKIKPGTYKFTWVVSSI